MKKSMLLLAALFCVLLTIEAQSKSSLKTPNDVVFMDHVIRLHKGSSGYLYDVFYQNNLVIHQDKNPFDQTTNGLRTEEDAIKIAKWQIIHIDPLHRQQKKGPEQIPSSVARQLQISSN
jgi:hypothetical protein